MANNFAVAITAAFRQAEATLVNRITGVVFGALLLGTSLIASPAEAGYVVTVSEQNGDVVANGSGPIDLTGLTAFPLTEFTQSFVTAAEGTLITGLPFPFVKPVKSYSDTIIGPSNFGSGSMTFAHSGSGDMVGILGGTFIVVPDDYVSGSPIADTATYTSQTLSGLGLVPGTYRWTWGAGIGDQNFTLIITATAVPEPVSAALLGSAVAGLLLADAIRRRTMSRRP